MLWNPDLKKKKKVKQKKGHEYRRILWVGVGKSAKEGDEWGI
jgi:hypothetical protein